MSPMQILYIFWRRMWIIVIAFVSTLVGAGGFMLIVPSRYDATALASIDPGQADPVNMGQPAGGGGAGLVGIFQGNMVALAKSNRVAVEVVKRLGLGGDPNWIERYSASNAPGVVDINQWIAAELLDHVEAKFGDKTGMASNVLNITYKSPSPAQSAAIANAFLSSFIDAAVDMKAAFAQQGAEWFDPQIEKIRADVVIAQKKLAQYEKESKVVASQGTGDSENEQLLLITSELSKTKAELIALESQLSGSPVAATESNEAQMVDQSLLTSLRSNLSAINSDIARLQKEVGAGNPKFAERLHTKKSLEDQINTLIADNKNKLKERIGERKGKIATLEAAREAQLQSMISVQARREELASLVREMEFRQSELERAQRAASQARLQSQLSFSNITVLDKATPPLNPSFPKPIIVWLGSPLLGLTLGLVAALLIEAFDRRIRCVPDLEFVLGAPVLGNLRSARPVPTQSKWAWLVSRIAPYKDAILNRAK